MVSPVDALTPKVQAALRAALGEQYAEVDPVIRPSQFADLQVNVALALCSRVYFMEKGRIQFEGSAADLLQRDDLARAVFLGRDGG